MAKIRTYNGEHHLTLNWPEHKFQEQKQVLDLMQKSREACEYIMELIEKDINPNYKHWEHPQIIDNKSTEVLSREISEETRAKLKERLTA